MKSGRHSQFNLLVNHLPQHPIIPFGDIIERGMMNDNINPGYSAPCIKFWFIGNTTTISIIQLLNIVKMVDVIVNTIPNPFLKTGVNQIDFHMAVKSSIIKQLFEIKISHILSKWDHCIQLKSSLILFRLALSFLMISAIGASSIPGAVQYT